MEEIDPSDEIVPTSAVTRLWRGGVALLLVLGVLYLFVARDYFFLRRTPEGARQEAVNSSLNEERLNVPLTIFIATGNEGVGSVRDEENVRRLVENADRIWEQADIDLVINEIIMLPVSDDEWRLFSESPRAFFVNVEQYNMATINVFLMGGLGSVNGLSWGGINSVAVADYTSVYDFRTLAHEIGHTLGLAHVPGNQGRLMYRGANGVKLSNEEIEQSRIVANDFQ